MANEQHIQWLLEGVDTWNARRDTTHFTPDLQQADLVAGLQEAGRVTTLGRADLAAANLSGASLVKTRLFAVDLRKARLSGADLTGADLRGAILEGARFNQAVLAAARLVRVEAAFVRANEARLDRADCSSANLAEAELTSASLQGAILRQTDLRRAFLHHSDLRTADLSGANLVEANLNFADLRGATLDGADLASASLRETDIRTVPGSRPTDLSSVSGLTQKQVNAMRGDRGVILPDGIVHPEDWPAPPRPPSAADAPGGLVAQVRARSLSEIRTALRHGYPEARALAHYITAQLQQEIAAHQMQPKPNDEAGLAAWTGRLNLLTEALVAVQALAEALPETPPDPLPEARLRGIRDRLAEVARAAQSVLGALDADTGTFGNLWKIGLVGACTSLLGAFGIPVAVGAPVAAGIVGVSTFRLTVENRSGGRGGRGGS